MNIWSRCPIITGVFACVPTDFSCPLEGSERGRIVSPPCHLSLCLTPWLVGVHHTVGCLPMCCPLIHCMALLRRCLMPGGLLGAISGILAGGILGFGAAECIVLLDTFARSCFLIWCFVFGSVQDLVIQRHHQPPHWSCLVRALFSGFVVWLVLFCCFLVFPVFWA